jgi:hypothetical protein
MCSAGLYPRYALKYLAADQGSFLVAAGACAVLGFILDTLFSIYLLTAVLGFILGTIETQYAVCTLFSIYLATDQGSLLVVASACAVLGFILGMLCSI